MKKIVLYCKTLLDCTEEQVREDMYVEMEGGIITAITQNPPKNCMVVDYANCTVMPGLINCHTHVCLIPEANPDAVLALGIPEITIKAYQNAKAYLHSGVTTIRDMGGIQGVDIAIRNGIDQKWLTGPDMLVSGQLLTMTGGHGHSIGMECDGVDACRKGARLQLKRGADLVKFMATGGILTKGVDPGSSQLTEEEMRAMVEEAHKRGKKTAAHAQGNQGIQNAIKAGVDSIEHGFFMNEETVRMMAMNKVFFIPTFSPPYQILTNGVKAGIAKEFVEKAEYSMKAHAKSFSMCREMGVPIAAGTDGGTPYNLHGDTYLEILLMKEHGMSNHESILSATRHAAACLGLTDRGTLEPGKKADLIAVEGNPLQDLGCLRNVKGIIKNGEIII